MNSTDHTPACNESPHFCICSHTAPAVISMDAAAKDAGALPERGLFLEDGAVRGRGLRQNFSPNPTPKDGPLSIALPAEGGWHVPKDQILGSFAEPEPEPTFPPIPRGGIKYPRLANRTTGEWKRIIAELDSAVERVRFWRRTALTASGIYAIDLSLTAMHWLGWF